MNVLSLFDGISCGRVALDRAGIDFDSYVASEIDEKAIQVSKNNWHDIIHVGDVCNIKGSLNIDLLMGGSPCQSFTRSSTEGFDGKSKLFWEFVRILNECQPRYFLLENVVMKKEWQKIITKELGVEPVEIDSSLFSAQKRQRLYWTNIPFNKNMTDLGIQSKDIFNGGAGVYSNDNGLLWKDEGHWRVRNGTKQGYLNVENWDVVNLDFPTSKTRRGRVGNKKANTLTTGCNQGIFVNGEIHKLSPIECERLQNLPDDYTKGVSDNQRKTMLGNGWTVDVIAHILKGIKREL